MGEQESPYFLLDHFGRFRAQHAAAPALVRLDLIQAGLEFPALLVGGGKLAGDITYTPAGITVLLDQPGAPRVARALELLLEEINAAPPCLPGDTRPITYRLDAPGPI